MRSLGNKNKSPWPMISDKRNWLLPTELHSRKRVISDFGIRKIVRKPLNLFCIAVKSKTYALHVLSSHTTYLTNETRSLSLRQTDRGDDDGQLSRLDYPCWLRFYRLCVCRLPDSRRFLRFRLCMGLVLQNEERSECAQNTLSVIRALFSEPQGCETTRTRRKGISLEHVLERFCLRLLYGSLSGLTCLYARGALCA